MQTLLIRLTINPKRCLPLKYPPHYAIPWTCCLNHLKKQSNGQRKCEKAGYGIYNPFKDLEIAKRFHGLQNIPQAKMMAIHQTLQLHNKTYKNETTHTFTYYLNVLYLLNTQIKHLILHNSHPNKNIPEDMIKMLISCTQITTLHKIKARTNINGNEHANAFAKRGRKLNYKDATTP